MRTVGEGGREGEKEGGKGWMEGEMLRESGGSGGKLHQEYSGRQTIAKMWS